MAEETPERLKIALIGRTKAGATTIGYHLLLEHGFKRKYLMDGVSKMVHYMYKYQKHQRLVSWEQKLKFYDAMYNIDNNIHIDYLLRRIGREDSTADVVVEDVRYINEAEALKNAGFIIVRVTPSQLKIPKIVNFDAAGKGLVNVHEWFAKEASKFPSDYSLLYSNNTEIKKSIDHIVNRLKEIQMKKLT